MRKVRVQTDTFQYDIWIGTNLTDTIVEDMASKFADVTKIMVICDQTIASLYLDPFVASLKKWKEPICKTVPNGEEAKSLAVYQDCMETAIKGELDRHSLIVAFGGGAVGDLAGFVAATFMRGIPYVQVPTTLLAHDSAVGGKTAVNHPLGKNMIGAFHQPKAVYYDLQYLHTLPKRERLSGFAELIKHGLIGNRELLNQLISRINEVDFDDLLFWEQVLEQGIKVKVKIVEQDTKEQNIRAFLNFGHTLGHAIENLSHYSISHGECVLIGMHFALLISEMKNSLSVSRAALTEWFCRLGYSIEVPDYMSIEQIMEQMRRDKKTIGGAIQYVLLKDIELPYAAKLQDEELVFYLKEFGVS
ncbi:3-dehydroquinate synthase [Bacillus oleivorans]|uniref:3-dehydroquinate synthase n=1 Tax=Bacillus oleivorans TaxID=1448271 RepID=A0A285CM79_9BACI|nr:3-dehydroquinate synthase [Bacillus oleivorans]SNX68146.1 3-dehydroquinate synthase [Bacillus oleivorans]